jgi:hypothetical protein
LPLIDAAELLRKKPFDSLTALLRHARAVAGQPVAWMPPSYEATATGRAARACPTGAAETAARW